MHRILLIDDDKDLAAPLGDYFERYGLTLESAHLPSVGLEQIRRSPPDLVILDIMLPEMDGFEVCRRIRRESDLPILMLTARGEVMDRVVGLEIGADDYLAKPFEPRELVARIQNILKRTTQNRSPDTRLTLGELVIDTGRQEVVLGDQPLTLTTMEFRLLALLAAEPGKVFSRDEILTGIKGVEADLYTRSVDILVSRLRHKLQPLDLIKTVWGSGYRLLEPQA